MSVREIQKQLSFLQNLNGLREEIEKHQTLVRLHIEKYERLLHFAGKVAVAQPMNSYSYEAEQMLKTLGHPEYTKGCTFCNDVPATMMTPELLLCSDCKEETDGE